MIAAKTTRWFEMKDPNLLLVGSSRRLWVIAPEILHTCSMSLCQPVNEEGCFVSFFGWKLGFLKAQIST